MLFELIKLLWDCLKDHDLQDALLILELHCSEIIKTNFQSLFLMQQSI